MLNPEYSLKLVWESGVFPLCHHSFEKLSSAIWFCVSRRSWANHSGNICVRPALFLSTITVPSYSAQQSANHIFCSYTRDQKPNSWTCNLVEVSGHNLESSQFLYGFLKPKGRGYGFLSGFPPFFFPEYSNCIVQILKRLREFEEIHKRLSEFYKIEISKQKL